MKKSYILTLPYYKQGDDLGNCKDQTNSDAEAFKLLADTLKGAANILEKLVYFAMKGELVVEQADTHFISLEMEEKLAETLMAEGFPLNTIEDEWDEGFDPEWEDEE